MDTRNIKRIDTGRTHGWQVCIQRDGVETTKLYSDKKYGGRKKALKKAQDHRDELLKDLPELPPAPGHLHAESIRHKAWKKLTQTGVKGIGLRWGAGKDHRYPHVQAMWIDEGTGERVHRARSIYKHGLDHALEVCCQLLYEGREETGPEPEVLFERARPVLKELVEARELEREARAEARRRSEEAKEKALQDAA